MTQGFVRAARASDAPELARVQVASWRASFADVVPDEVLTELTSAGAEKQWTGPWAGFRAGPGAATPGRSTPPLPAS